jgi:2-polyprenyl-3-methyl-5-hydroxy-6-metoxy-1,4-benzoquinol methylase
MNDEHQMIDLQIDHPDVDDLQKDFRPKSIRAHVLSLIHRWPYEQLMVNAKGKKVLELGCNKGFGTVIYADHATSVKAVDTSSGAIEKARELNAHANIEYICLDSWTLPFADDSFDLVVIFQVIEHIALDKMSVFLSEIKRVTSRDGQIFFSTPNRNIRLLPFQKPRNEFHTKEYSAQDLDKLLSRYFLEVRVEGLFGEEALNQIERRRVRQKPSKVYFTAPLKKYVIRPIQRLLLNSDKMGSNGTSSRRGREELKKARLRESDGVVSEPIDYPFTTSDLELRSHSLRRALDLRATVLRVK